MPAQRARRRAFRIKRKDGWQNGSVLTRRYVSICPHRQYSPRRRAPDVEEPWACQGVAEHAALVYDQGTSGGFIPPLSKGGTELALPRRWCDAARGYRAGRDCLASCG